MSKIIPVLLALLGLAGGVGAGIALRPVPEPEPVDMADAAPCGEPGAAAEDTAAPESQTSDPAAEGSFVAMDNQFVIPLIEEGEVAALVVMSLTLEVDPEMTDRVAERTPRLRDRFLRVMLDHANAGGFDGAFTSNGAIDRMTSNLLDVARTEIGNGVRDILLLDIGKQAS